MSTAHLGLCYDPPPAEAAIGGLSFMQQSIDTMPETTLPFVEPRLTDRLRRVLSAARAERAILPDVPELSLYLLNADFSSAALSREEMLAVLDYPAYWAFCWASGQVLARELLDNPGWVEGCRVLDFGCGSGVAAIAAARAGAARVVACDLDPDALLATRRNAELNGVAIELAADFETVAGSFDLILVADVLYDRANLPWLARLLSRAPRVLVADSRVRDFREPHYRHLGSRTSSTWPDLDEFDEFRRVNLYLGQRPAG
jgi:predicted nicotinamide N-methyase